METSAYTVSMVAIYPGSFDPITNGHLDIISRAASIFSSLTILVSQSPVKKELFSFSERVNLIQKSVAALGLGAKVQVESFSGLVMDYAKNHGIKVVVRGVRGTSDLENEFAMASMNRTLYPGCDTVFLMTRPELMAVSSSLVKEIASWNGDIKSFVPSPVIEALMKKRSP